MNNDGDVTAEKNGELAIPDNEVLDNIASYFSNDIDRVVYYNPINGVKCDETDYDSSNSTPGYKGTEPEGNQTSCLKWYKYSTNKDGTINMILDHNTEVGTPYYSTSNDNTHGPESLMSYLDFDDWSTSLIRSDIYTAYKLNADSSKTAIFTNATGNAVNYSGKKARLITAQEIAEITGASSTTSPGISWDEQNSDSHWFWLDGTGTNWQTNKEVSDRQYQWLYDTLTLVYGNGNYWTSSPVVGGGDGAWCVSNNNGLFFFFGTSGTPSGLRPVITVPASSIVS